MPITHMASDTMHPTQKLMKVIDSRKRLTRASASRNTWAVRQRIRRLTHSESIEMRIWSRVATKKYRLARKISTCAGMAGAINATPIIWLPSSTVTAIALSLAKTKEICSWIAPRVSSGPCRLSSCSCSLFQIIGARATNSDSGAANTMIPAAITLSNMNTTIPADSAEGTPKRSTRSATGPNISPTTTARVMGARNTCPTLSANSSPRKPIRITDIRAAVPRICSN